MSDCYAAESVVLLQISSLLVISIMCMYINVFYLSTLLQYRCNIVVLASTAAATASTDAADITMTSVSGERTQIHRTNWV